METSHTRDRGTGDPQGWDRGKAIGCQHGKGLLKHPDPSRARHLGAWAAGPVDEIVWTTLSQGLKWVPSLEETLATLVCGSC